jgi:DNA polymerase-4
MIAERGLTLVGVALANLDDEEHGGQLPLPFDQHRHRALDAALDHIRDRYGSKAVDRAVLLHRDIGPSVPLLPD